MQRILIVDDNQDIREVLGTYVAKEGFEPVVAKDGFEALEMFRKTNPAVILLDVMMPGMDGYKVCEKIREESDVPIILVTAKGEDYERVMGLDIGADDYVVKPFSAAEVMARVRAVLRRMGRSDVTEEKKILKPTFYRFQKEGKYGTHTDTENPYKWNERTIADILDKCRFSKNSEFTYVLQPMSRKEALRKYLFDNGFSILTELLAREGDKIYTVFSAKYIGEATVYTHFDLIFGKMPPTDSPYFHLYLEKEYSRLKRQYDGQIASASSNEQSVSQLSNVISQIERILSNGV